MKALKIVFLGASILGGAGPVNADSLRFYHNLSLPVFGASSPSDDAGTSASDWIGIDPIYGEWGNTGEPYGCSNWSPSASSMGKGVIFTQTASDCHQDEIRSVTPQRRNVKTGKVETIEQLATSETRINDHATKTRSETGILEEWNLIDPRYTDWNNVSPTYDCGTWAPDPSSYYESTAFTQTSNDCKVDQERLRQEQEQEINTLSVRNLGEPIQESQIKSGQTAIREYDIQFSAWSDIGTATGCGEWLPDPSNTTESASIVQTQSNCTIQQSRQRTESYNPIPSGDRVMVSTTNEVKSVQLSSPPTRNYEVLYTKWIQDGDVSDCSEWSPNAPRPDVYSNITQTRSDCKMKMTRQRSESYQSANSEEVILVGTRSESKEVIDTTIQKRSYITQFTEWKKSAEPTGCTEWSPEASTQKNGMSFTQYRSGCVEPQSRQVTETYTPLTGNGQKIVIGPYAETRMYNAGMEQRQATGTKPELSCLNNDGIQEIDNAGVYTSTWTVNGVSSSQTYGASKITINGVDYFRGDLLSGGEYGTMKLSIFQVCH